MNLSLLGKAKFGKRAALLAALSCGALANQVAHPAANSAKALAPYAIVAGTVFRENGFSLPGATITLVRAPESRKAKKLEARSDARGEFAFRVKAEAGRYIVKAEMKGFQSAEREVAVSGEQFAEAERKDVTLQLAAESKSVRGESK